MVTPFDQQGRVDFEAMKEHIDFLIEKGVNNLYPLGTMGEAALMSVPERKELAEKIVNYVDNRVGVFIHIGSLSQADAVELARHAESIGADGVGAVSPYFYHIDQTDLYNYFAAISESVSEDFPVYMYNLPGMTGNDILPETVVRLAQRSNIVGIKNTMPVDMRISQLSRSCPKDFDVISGDDLIALSGLTLGAKGLVTGTSNIFPEVLVSMYKRVQENDLRGAAAEQHKMYEIAEMLDCNYKPATIKAILELRGFRRTYSRAPLQRLCTEEEYAHFRSRLREIFAGRDYIA